MSKLNLMQSKNQQIKIDIEKEYFDKFLELVGFAFVIALLILPLYYYSQLPEQIPVHFNFQGEIDGYGPKITLWIFAILGTLLFIGLFILNKYPHKFNYLVKITEQNAEFQYKKATRLIRLMNTLIVAMMFFIDYEIVRISITNKPFRLAPMIYLFLFLLFVIIGYYIISSLKNKE